MTFNDSVSWCLLLCAPLPHLPKEQGRSDTMSLPRRVYRMTAASVLGALLHTLSAITCSGVTRNPSRGHSDRPVARSAWQGMEGPWQPHDGAWKGTLQPSGAAALGETLDQSCPAQSLTPSFPTLPPHRLVKCRYTGGQVVA